MQNRIIFLTCTRWNFKWICKHYKSICVWAWTFFFYFSYWNLNTSKSVTHCFRSTLLKFIHMYIYPKGSAWSWLASWYLCYLWSLSFVSGWRRDAIGRKMLCFKIKWYVSFSKAKNVQKSMTWFIHIIRTCKHDTCYVKYGVF